MIHSNFFESSELAKYTDKEKLFLLGLVCFADDFGKFWLNINRLKANIFAGESKTSTIWIKKTIKKFIEDGVLCEYSHNKIDYCHFPNWFVKGWILKQRIDHPRDNLNPDCPICQTEKIARRKREISRTRKDKVIKKNKTKETAKSKYTKNPQHIGRFLKNTLKGKKGG